MNRGDRFHARGTGPRWPEDAGRRCRVQEVTWTAWDESARSRVLRDVTMHPNEDVEYEVVADVISSAMIDESTDCDDF